MNDEKCFMAVRVTTVGRKSTFLINHGTAKRVGRYAMLDAKDYLAFLEWSETAEIGSTPWYSSDSSDYPSTMIVRMQPDSFKEETK